MIILRQKEYRLQELGKLSSEVIGKTKWPKEPGEIGKTKWPKRPGVIVMKEGKEMPKGWKDRDLN